MNSATNYKDPGSRPDVALDPLDTTLARHVLEAAPTIIYVYDVQNERSVYQNRHFGGLLGHSNLPVPSNDWKTLIHPEDALRFTEYRRGLKNIASGETMFWEYRMRDSTGAWRWFLSRDALLSRDDAGKPLMIVGNASEITEQKSAEEHQEILLGEMRHRAKNLISLIEGIARLSRPKNQPQVDAFIDAYMGRLKALLHTGDIVLSSDQRTANLRDVIKTALVPFHREDDAKRITLQGPPVALSERTAGSMALAIHELATNAVKYGALSVPQGAVAIEWMLSRQDATDRFSMEWKEAGGPTVAPPQTEGFGGRVIRHAVAHEPAGNIMLDYRPDGLFCAFAFEIVKPVSQ